MSLHQELLNAFNLHRDALLGFITKRTGDAQLAQDILQDLYLKLEGQNSATDIKYPKAYLYRISNNLIIDHQRFQSKFSDNAEDDDLEQINELSPEIQLAHQQRLSIVSEALNELPDKTRDVFKMQRIQQVDKSEVADKLGISVNMVEKHLRRAVQYCRDKLYKLEK